MKIHMTYKEERDVVRTYWKPTTMILSMTTAQKLEAISAAAGFEVTQWRGVPGGTVYYDSEESLIADMAG